MVTAYCGHRPVKKFLSPRGKHPLMDLSIRSYNLIVGVRGSDSLNPFIVFLMRNYLWYNFIPYNVYRINYEFNNKYKNLLTRASKMFQKHLEI